MKKFANKALVPIRSAPGTVSSYEKIYFRENDIVVNDRIK